MKFTCSKEELQGQVTTVARLATTRATLPILQNIYMATKKNALIIKATDLEQTLEGSVKGEEEENGEITVPARVLVEYLQNNTDNQITLISDDTNLMIESANHKAKIKGLAAVDYPTLPKISFQAETVISSSELSGAISRTLFATANDETRPILTGLLFRFKGDTLTLVGTDGYRLAYVTIPIKNSLTGDYILPKRSLQELVRLLGNDDEAVLSFASAQAKISVGRTTFITRVLEGAFPAYEAIIPKTSPVSLSISSAVLLQSLKLASLFSRDSAYSTKIDVEEKKLKVTAISPSLGENSNEITVSNGPTEGLTISVNAQYLIDALGALSGDIDLKFIDSKSPVVITLPKDLSYLYLLMPLRSQ